MEPGPSSSSPPAAGKRAHSEDYFGDYRNYWWNPDFLELMARRLDWGSRHRLLEVGSGAGHWMRTFAPFLPDGCEVVGIDSDPKWADPNAAWIKDLTVRGISVKIQPGNATALPFADATFDFVTCQTVLIHLREPRVALREMRRVLKPGGLLLCVEPDNFGTFSSASSLSEATPSDDLVADFRFTLTQQRGRIALGLGDLSLGGRLPGLMAEAGLTDIQVFLSDKVLMTLPPYDSPEQVAILGDIEKWFSAGVDFSRAEARTNYLAGGGNQTDFELHWAREIARRKQYLDAIRDKKYDSAGGTLMYLVAGSKA